MRRAFVVLDDFLMDKVFQRLAWWFQKLTGRTNFWLARTCYIISALCFVLWIGPIYLLGSWLIIVPWVAGLYVIFTVLINQRLEKLEKRFLENLSEGAVINELRLLGTPLRVGMVFICTVLSSQCILLYKIVDEVSWLSGVPFSAAAAIGIYFQSCTPLPLCRSKVREWLETFAIKAALFQGGKLARVRTKRKR